MAAVQGAESGFIPLLHARHELFIGLSGGGRERCEVFDLMLVEGVKHAECVVVPCFICLPRATAPLLWTSDSGTLESVDKTNGLVAATRHSKFAH